MIFWIDAQLSPQLAPWLTHRFGVTAYAVRDLGLRDATDREIYDAAHAAGTVVMTKDRDFPDLLARLGSPPEVIWLTCGNTSNARMRQIFETLFPQARLLLQGGDVLVEIADLPWIRMQAEPAATNTIERRITLWWTARTAARAMRPTRADIGSRPYAMRLAAGDVGVFDSRSGADVWDKRHTGGLVRVRNKRLEFLWVHEQFEGEF